MIFSSKTEVFVGQVIHAYGTRYRVLKVHDLSKGFLKTTLWIVEATEMLMKD